MNKWEKEVQQSLLNDEQQVLNILKTAYAGTLRDVQDKMSAYFVRIQANPNDVSAIYQFRYQQALQDQIYNILDNLKNQNYQTISEYLEHSYENGWLGAMYDIHRQGIPIITPINQENAVRAITINSKISVPMYTRLGTDIDRLRVSIAAEVTRGIVSGSTWHDTAARISGQANISAYNAMRIARTEGHRVQCNAQYDACNSANQSGADVVNQWDSTMDSRTRDTHRRLHKQLREVGQPFEIDGKKALYPGAFGIPEEDIHCRCTLLQRARWALSEQELQQLRNTPEAKQLAETENFEQFKNKYLELTENSANRLTNSSGNGTIELSQGRYAGLFDSFIDKLSDLFAPKSPELVSQEYLDALPKLSVPDTMEQALQAVNPTGDNKNCQHCVPAYVMRRNGYDVVASESVPALQDRIGLGGFKHVFKDSEWIKCSGTGVEQITEFLQNEGHGAIVEISVTGENFKHLFIGENKNGNVMFIDPQVNSDDVAWYFDKIKPELTEFARIDGLPVTEFIKDCVVARK